MFDRLTQCACQDSERIAVNFTRFDSNREITFENSSYFNFNTLSPLLTIQNKNTMEDKKEKEKAGSSGAPVSYNQVFEEKFRSILFPEPYFSEYLRELESKNRTLVADWNEIERDKYIRYLRTWRRGIKLHVANRHLQMMREIHCHKLINFIERVFKDGGKMYTDLEIHVENERFLAHRLVIACYAPFIFHKLSRTPRAEDTRKIRLTGIKAAPFAVILEYMYSGMAQPNDSNFLAVLDTAIRFFMYEFADTWVELYEEKFGSRTSQLLFRSKIARRYKWNNYVRKLNKVLALDFENLLVSSHFVELSYEEISDLLKENDIGVRNEVVLYMGVLKWLKYDLEARKSYVLPLISLIRFPLMSEEEIFACYNPPILKDVTNQSEIKALMADALNFHVKKRSGGKAVELPNSVETRNYRLTNSSQLKLWSVEDQKLDRDASLSRTGRSQAPHGALIDSQLSAIDSKELDVKDLEHKTYSERIQPRERGHETLVVSGTTAGKLPPPHLPGRSAVHKVSSGAFDSGPRPPIPSLSSDTVSPSTPAAALTMSTDEKPTDLRIDSLERTYATLFDRMSPKSADRGSATARPKHSSIGSYEPTAIGGFVCRCDKQPPHRSVLECQTDRAAKRMQAATQEFVQTQSPNSSSAPSQSTSDRSPERTIATIESVNVTPSDTKPTSSLCTNSSIIKINTTGPLSTSSETSSGLISPASSIASSTSNEPIASVYPSSSKSTPPESLSMTESVMGEPASNTTGKSTSTTAPIPRSDSKSSVRTFPLELPPEPEAPALKSSTHVPQTSVSSTGSIGSVHPTFAAVPRYPPSSSAISLSSPSNKRFPSGRTLFVLLADSLQIQNAGIYIYKLPVNDTAQHRAGDTRSGSRLSVGLPHSNITASSSLTNLGISSGSSTSVTGGWQKVANFAQANMLPLESVVLAHHNQLYVIGGLLRGVTTKPITMHASKFIYRYGLQEQSLKRVGELRIPRVLHCAAIIQSRVYVVGGLRTPGVPLNTIEVFDLRDLCMDAGQIRIPSYARFGASCAHFRKRLWIVGGIAKIESSFHLLSEIWVLDPNQRKWFKSKFPVPIAYASIAAVDADTLLVVGGRSVSLSGELQPSDKVWMYSHHSRRWAQLTSASLRKPRCNACLLVADRQLYLLGGCSENDVDHLRGTSAEVLDLREPGRGWQSIERLPVPICGHTVARMSL